MLPAQAKKINKLWVWASRDTEVAARAVQAWREPTNAILKRAPKEMTQSDEYDFAIVVPRAEKATEVAALMLIRPASQPAYSCRPTWFITRRSYQVVATTSRSKWR